MNKKKLTVEEYWDEYDSWPPKPARIASLPVDFVKETQDSISAIMNSVDGVKTDKSVKATGKEAVGSIKSVMKADGNQKLYRKQANGKWAVADSPLDLWGLDLTDDQKGDIVDGMETDKPTTKAASGTITSLIPNAEAYLDNNLNVLLVGLHGTGKTVSVQDLAKARGLNFKYYSCSTLDPFTDLVGVPTPRDYCTTCKVYHKDLPVCPDCGARTVESLKMVRPREVDEAEIIFFDEFNRADTKTQNALFEIMQFKSINGEPLPNLKMCWAAINPPDDEQNYQVDQLDPALLDRFDLYIEITPKPNVTYMAQHMPAPIAAALKVWWEQHQEAIKNGSKDAHSDYVSPRRLEKIGLVWCATKNTRSVTAALPMGGNFEKRKLIDLLKNAQQQVDKDNGVETEYDDAEPDLSGAGLGDRPADQFTYRLANMRIQQTELADWLTDNPLHAATHDKVAQQLVSGVGGEELVLKYGKILNALNPANLEALIIGFPTAKVNEMRKGFVKLYTDNMSEAATYKSLYGVLDAGASGVTNWPVL